MVVRPVADGDVVARIEDMDYSRMHKDHVVEGAYPGEPIAHAAPGRIVVFLINQTTNQVGPSSVIRYVVPIRDVVLRVKTPAPAKVATAVTGGQVHHEQQG